MVSDQTPLPPPRARRHPIPSHPPSLPFPIPCIQKRPRISLIVSTTQHRTHLRPPSLAKAFQGTQGNPPHPTTTHIVSYLQTNILPYPTRFKCALVERLISQSEPYVNLGGRHHSTTTTCFHACLPASFPSSLFCFKGAVLTAGVEEVGFGFGLAGALMTLVSEKW